MEFKTFAIVLCVALAAVSVADAGTDSVPAKPVTGYTPFGSFTTSFSTTPNYLEHRSDSSNVFYFQSGLPYGQAMSMSWTTTANRCYCRLRAGSKSMSPSPGTYASYEPSKTFTSVSSDSALENFGHDWVDCTSGFTGTAAFNSASYKSLPDGYYLFTFSCSMGHVWQAEDFAFKFDSKPPLTTVAPAIDYDPTYLSRAAYTFTLNTVDYHGTFTNVGTLNTGDIIKVNPPYTTSQAVTNTVEKATLVYSWKLDNAATYTTQNSNVVTLAASPGAGPHCISAYATDYTRNKETYDALYCWTVENFERNTGCTFSYSLNSAEYVSTGGNGYADLTAIPDGTTTFAIKATDMYGHTTASANSFSWTIDTAKPTATFLAAGTWFAETNIPTATKATFKYASSRTGSYFKYQVDGGVFVTAGRTVTQVFATNTFAVASCSGSAHSFSVRAIDYVGNVGDLTQSSFTTEPINTKLVLTNGVSNVVPQSTAIFDISAIIDETVPSVFGYEYKIGTGSWITGVHFPLFGVTGLADGAYTITARALSSGGCYDPTPLALSFTIDTTKPVTTLPCPASPTNTATETITGVVTDATIKAAGTEYRLGTGAWIFPAVNTATGAFTISLTGLVEGSYTLQAKSTDTAGHVGLTALCTWVVDFGPPQTWVVSGPPTPAYASTSADFTFDCQENGCVYMYSVDGGAFTSSGTTMSLTGALSEGVHTLKVYAIDTAGNADPTPYAYTWIVYGDDNYGGYCENCSFQTSGVTPMAYQPKDSYYVHGDL